MEQSSNLVENLTCSQSLVLPDHFDHYPRSQMKIEARSSTMHEFHGLDQLQLANISPSMPPVRTVQNPLFPEVPCENYSFHSAVIDLDFYECKPFVETYGGGHGQVMDNFHGGGCFGNFTERTGLGLTAQYFNYELDVKPMSFVAPDEISCISAENGYSYQNPFGTNKARALASSSARRTYKSRKQSHVVKGQWTTDEDRLLVQLVEKFGVRKWSHIAQMLRGRIGKQCRERWHNHLRPDIKKDVWTDEEDKILIQSHTEIGNKWAEIAKRLPGRTENSIKNHWNATKRRQYSKRKCRTKRPRGTLLQDYIKSLNLGDPRKQAPSGSGSGGGSSKASRKTESSSVVDDRVVPNYEFDELPISEMEFDDEKLFQFESFLGMDGTSEDEKMEMEKMVDEMVNAEVDEEEEGPRRDVDLVEMMSQINSNNNE